MHLDAELPEEGRQFADGIGPTDTFRLYACAHASPVNRAERFRLVDARREPDPIPAAETNGNFKVRFLVVYEDHLLVTADETVYLRLRFHRPETARESPGAAVEGLEDFGVARGNLGQGELGHVRENPTVYPASCTRRLSSRVSRTGPNQADSTADSMRSSVTQFRSDEPPEHANVLAPRYAASAGEEIDAARDIAVLELARRANRQSGGPVVEVLKVQGEQNPPDVEEHEGVTFVRQGSAPFTRMIALNARIGNSLLSKHLEPTCFPDYI